MPTIGIRTLKNRLSYYLAQVKRGRTVQVTDRGHEVALIIPLPHDAEQQALWRLVRSGQASWVGGKPQGARRRITITGPSVAAAVIEDRR